MSISVELNDGYENHDTVAFESNDAIGIQYVNPM